MCPTTNFALSGPTDSAILATPRGPSNLWHTIGRGWGKEEEEEDDEEEEEKNEEEEENDLEVEEDEYMLCHNPIENRLATKRETMRAQGWHLRGNQRHCETIHRYGSGSLEPTFRWLH